MKEKNQMEKPIIKWISNHNQGLISSVLLIFSIFIFWVFMYLAKEISKNNVSIFGLLAIGSIFIFGFISSIPYKSTNILLEFFSLLLCWLTLMLIDTPRIETFYFPLFTSFVIVLGFLIKPKLSLIFIWFLNSSYFFYYINHSINSLNTADYLLLGTIVLMLATYSFTILIKPPGSVRKADVLVCSYSGNTSHYANLFIEGMKEAGAEANVIRFHYYYDFKAEFSGDALVVAFPVIGLKPPWPMSYYLLTKLPWGAGKPAYILYTCIGGPENSAITTWLILTLRGYKVIGRNWAIYPLNVATFRLISAKLWKLIDSFLPFKFDENQQRETGKAFASGRFSGMPFIFFLSPLIVLGILTDNKYLNRIIYRNHIIKKRCNGCGVCVNYCPSERLSLIDNIPKATGTCFLCLGCVNLCTYDAMQFWCLTEYGNRYEPRWRKLVVKKKNNTDKFSQLVHDKIKE